MTSSKALTRSIAYACRKISQIDAASGLLKVDKLDATNYFSWKQNIQLVLSLRELDEFIEQEPPAEDARNYLDWKKSDRKAKAVIGLSLSDEHLELLSGVAAAKEMRTSARLHPELNGY